MKKVFISGSIKFDKLELDGLIKIQEKINEYKKNWYILVGDASGVDEYILSVMQKKPHLSIYSIFNRSRIPINKVNESWKKEFGSIAYINLTTSNEQWAKDNKMLQDCDECFVVCKLLTINRYGNEQFSNGSLKNMVNAVLNNKKCFIYINLTNKIYDVKVLDGFLDELKKDIFQKITNDGDFFCDGIKWNKDNSGGRIEKLNNKICKNVKFINEEKNKINAFERKQSSLFI